MYKILSADWKYHGIQYKEGLNQVSAGIIHIWDQANVWKEFTREHSFIADATPCDNGAVILCNLRPFAEFFNQVEENIVIEALRHDPLLLSIRRRQTDAMCYAAVSKNGYTLAYVNEQTPGLCEAAVRNKPRALWYVRHQTPSLCQLAVKLDPLALDCVNDQTEELCIKAIQASPFAFKMVRHQTQAICQAAVESCCFLLPLVKEQTRQMCITAVQVNAFMLQYVREQDDEICCLAIKLKPAAVTMVKKMSPRIRDTCLMFDATKWGLLAELMSADVKPPRK
jgi:hypothetical protein